MSVRARVCWSDTDGNEIYHLKRGKAASRHPDCMWRGWGRVFKVKNDISLQLQDFGPDSAQARKAEAASC